MIAAGVLAGLFVAVYATVAVTAIRRRHLARLAVREVVRRRWQSVLVVAGLTIGSAGITAALVGGDAVRESMVLNAYRTWGAVDLTVTAEGGQPFPAEVAAGLADDPDVAAATDGVEAGADLVGTVANPVARRVEGAVRIVGLGPVAGDGFGEYVLADGSRVAGGGLAAGSVLVSERLAASLDAGVGDRLDVVVGDGHRIALSVGGLVRSEGPGAYGLRPALFLPLEDLHPVIGAGNATVVRVSAVGDPRSGLDAAPAAAAAVEEALGAWTDTGRAPEPRSASPPAEEGRAGASAPFEVREVKADEVDQAASTTVWFRSMLLGLSTMLVAAGLTLVVNLALMLAEERRARLGVLRAIGIRRRDVVRLAVIEGAIYSLAATIVGAALGVGAGAVLARQFVVAVTQVYGDVADLSVTIPLAPETLVAAFSGGALLTLGTVWVASRRTARMTITAAIRGLPEPAGARARSRSRAALIALLAGVGVAGTLPPEPAVRLVAGTLAIAAGAALLRRRLPVRVHATATGAALTGWSLVVVSANTDMGEPEAFMALFTLGTLVSVFGLAILAAGNLGVVERVAGLVGGRSGRMRATLRLPLAELARRPLRTGLTTGAFGVILAALTVFAMLFGTLASDVERDAAGYDVIAAAPGADPVELPPALADQVAREARVPTAAYTGRVASTWLVGESVHLPIHALSDELLADPPTGLQSREARYDNDAEVWAALATEPGTAVAPLGLAGDAVTIERPDGEPVSLRLAGIPIGPLSGLLVSADAFAELAAGPASETILLDLVPGADPAAFGRELEAELFASGVDAATTAERLELLDAANRNFFASSELLMRLGLAVGVLTLGILSLRAVFERRRAIGVARAIGFRRRQIMVGLLVESVTAATIGIGVGLIAGASLSRILLGQVYPSLPLRVDAALLVAVVAACYLAVVSVTALPARRASRLVLVEAIRAE